MFQRILSEKTIFRHFPGNHFASWELGNVGLFNFVWHYGGFCIFSGRWHDRTEYIKTYVEYLIFYLRLSVVVDIPVGTLYKTTVYYFYCIYINLYLFIFLLCYFIKFILCYFVLYSPTYLRILSVVLTVLYSPILFYSLLLYLPI